MEVFRVSKRFPPEERFSLTDQVRRASRSVAANISEGWRKRRYVAAFRAKFNDAEGEAAEVQTLIELAYRCSYCTKEEVDKLDAAYGQVLAQLTAMIRDADRWCEGIAH